MTSILFSDFALLLEFACTIATLCYLIKLAFVAEEDRPEVSLPLSTTSRFCLPSYEKRRWFDVGTLVPVSKRSLAGQRL